MTQNESENLFDELDDDTIAILDGKVKPTLPKVVKLEEKLNGYFVPELVLFYGPPCSGKTSHFHQKYGATHIKVDPPVLYDKQFSFHRLITLVIDYLAKGRNVVIDDTNMLLRTRQSYLKSIQEHQKTDKLSGLSVRIIAVSFHPLGGLNQCLWANEWSTARYLSGFPNPKKFLAHTSDELEEWFHGGEKEPPKKEEGFSEVIHVKTRLFCEDTEQFDTSSLIIDISSIFEFVSEEGSSQRSLVLKRAHSLDCTKTFQQFHAESPDAIILFLIDETSFYPMTLEIESDVEKKQEMIARWRRQFSSFLESWSNTLNTSLFYTVAEYDSLEKNSFFSLPNPGMLCYSQFLHTLDLRQAIFVSDDNTMSSLGFSLGMSTVIPGSQFFAASGWDVASKLRKFSLDCSREYPEFLDVTEFQDVYRSHDYVSAPILRSGRGRMHCRCDPTLPKTSVGPASPSTVNSSQPLPNIDYFSSSPIRSSAPTVTLPALSEGYIRGHISPAIFERGMQYFEGNTIFNRRRKGFSISGMCKGSSCPPYSLQVTLSNRNEKIRSCVCSCPIGSGTCKHIAAFLLSWVHEASKFKVQPLGDAYTPIPASPIPATPKKTKGLSQNEEIEVIEEEEENETQEQDEDPTIKFMSERPLASQSQKKRKLPKWMQDSQSPIKKVKMSRTDGKTVQRNIFPDSVDKKEDNINLILDTSSIPTVKPSSTPIRSVAEVLADLDRELSAVDNEDLASF